MVAALSACSTLNEDIKPSIDCTTDPSYRICEDAVLATCSGGEPVYRVCEDEGLVCGDGGSGPDCVACAAQCTGRVCGDDSCGGSCGECPEGASCTVTGQCDPPVAFDVTSVEVVDDENGDGLVAPGESASLRIHLENTGIALARQVRATLSASTVGVSIDTGPLLHFGDLGIGDISCGASASVEFGSCSTASLPRFHASSDVLSAGQSVTFQLTITTLAGYVVQRSFSYQLAAIDQDISVASASLVSEPNDDGVLSPGEVGALRVMVTNDGDATGVGVFGVLSAETAGVTVLSPTVYFGDLASGESACGSRTSAEAGSCSSEVLSSVRVANSVTSPWLTFRMTFYDSFGTESSAMFTQGIGPIDQSFTLSDVEIVSDAGGDGSLSPGEWALLRVKIRNAGTARALGVVAVMTSDDPRINVNNGAALYVGDLDAGAEQCGVWKVAEAGSCSSLSLVRVTIAYDVTPGTVITFPLVVSDKYGNTFELSYQYTVAP